MVGAYFSQLNIVISHSLFIKFTILGCDNTIGKQRAAEIRSNPAGDPAATFVTKGRLTALYRVTISAVLKGIHATPGREDDRWAASRSNE